MHKCETSLNNGQARTRHNSFQSRSYWKLERQMIAMILLVAALMAYQKQSSHKANVKAVAPRNADSSFLLPGIVDFTTGFIK